MPKQNILTSNFTTGEVSPLVRGRQDSKLYAGGLETCENFIIRPQGPLFRRSGAKAIRSTRVPSEESILVPFEFSDLSAYVLEFGLGYINIYKDGHPLQETTNLEAEFFTVHNNGGLVQLWFSDHNSTADASLPPIVTTRKNNGSGKYRYTSTTPHCLRTGVTVFDASLASYSVTRIDEYTFDITSIAYASDGAYTWYSHGLLAGDEIYISGAGNFSLLTERWLIVKSIDAYQKITLANVAYSGTSITGIADDGSGNFRITSVAHGLANGDNISISGVTNYGASINGDWNVEDVTTDTFDLDGSTFTGTGAVDGTWVPYPTMEEAHILPVEISTSYGFSETVTITDVASSGGGSPRYVITAANHMLADGDTVYIKNTGTSADGSWVIEYFTPSVFALVGSTFANTSSVGTFRKVVGASDLKLMKFVQSADVLYIFHPDHPTKKLARLDTDGDRGDWLLSTVDWKDGPYLPANSLAPSINATTPADGSIHADVYMQLSGYSHTATVTAAVAFAAAAADQNDYLEYRVGDQWRLAKLTSASSSSTTGTVEIVDNIMSYIDASDRLSNTPKKQPVAGTSGSSATNPPPGYRTAYNKGMPYLVKSIDPRDEIQSGVTGTASGTLKSQYTGTFSREDVGKFVRYSDGTAGAAAITSPAGSETGGIYRWAMITKVLTATSGQQATHTAALTMVSNNDTGNFVITAESRTATLTAYRAGSTYAAFATTDVGRLVRLGWGNRWVWGKITAYTSTSVVTVALYADVPRDPHDARKLAGSLDGKVAAPSATGRTYDWRLGAWSYTTGFPSCGTFHEQRLFAGRTDAEPQTFWGSISADFENMAPTEPDGTVLDDNAITFTIASTKVNPIKWMESGPTMTIGTSGGEWQVKAGSAVSEPISPSNISVTPHTGHGSAARPKPVRVNSSVLFCDRPGKRVRELSYDYSVDGLITRDTTHISEHILRDGGGVLETAYQQEPNNIIWFLLNDGTLASLTWNREQEVAAWARHIIAGGGEDAVVESIACVPSADSSRDDLYMIVKRAINGATQRWVEMLEEDFYPTSASTKTGMRFLDAGRLIENFTGTVVTGLTHLEDKTVRALGNGANLGTFRVSSGAITLLSAYNEVWVGLDYTSLAKSLPPEAASAFGTSHGQIKQVKKMQARILNSLDFEYGWSGATLNSRTALELNKGQSSNFVTDTVELVPNAPYNPESQWTIQTSKPYPLNVLSVSLTVECGE